MQPDFQNLQCPFAPTVGFGQGLGQRLQSPPPPEPEWASNDYESKAGFHIRIVDPKNPESFGGFWPEGTRQEASQLHARTRRERALQREAAHPTATTAAREEPTVAVCRV